MGILFKFWQPIVSYSWVKHATQCDKASSETGNWFRCGFHEQCLQKRPLDLPYQQSQTESPLSWVGQRFLIESDNIEVMKKCLFRKSKIQLEWWLWTLNLECLKQFLMRHTIYNEKNGYNCEHSKCKVYITLNFMYASTKARHMPALDQRIWYISISCYDSERSSCTHNPQQASIEEN